jgi:hypothetical protein
MIKTKPKWWTTYWIIIVVLTVIIGITLPILQHIPAQNAILYLSLVLVAEGIAYYGRVKPSVSLNRIMYILIGVPIAFILWLILWNISLSVFGRWINEDFVLVFGSLAICFLIGGIIGDLIGRLRHYKGPEQYSP